MTREQFRDRMRQILQDGADLRSRFLHSHFDVIVTAAHAIAACLMREGKLLIFGNGGSAADAQHMAAEFVGRFRKERPALPAIALTTDSSALTCISNDYGYDQVFSRQIEALGKPGDLVIAISTSGKSPNVLQASCAARAKGLHIIGLCGSAGMAAPVDLDIAIPCDETARIQELHITVIHILCEFTETILEEQGWRLNAPASGEKVVTWARLLEMRDGLRKQGKTVVWTNGCFDILHAGHLQSLQAAKALGDILVVGVNSDDSVRRIKGPGRPVTPLQQRMELLAGLACVDLVTVLDAVTPQAALAELQPEIHCKGADYAPPNGKPIPEVQTVLDYGGRVEFIPLLPDVSTTAILQRLKQGTRK